MNSQNDIIKYSETFYSAQGEGQYIGIPSLWMRFFLCNLQCHGFGQEDPTNPDTYELPFEEIDISDITDVRDLPVFDKGCDSSYTWSRKYRHLITNRTVQDAPPITSTPEPVFPLSRPLEPQAPINNYENVNFGSFLYNPKTGW